MAISARSSAEQPPQPFMTGNQWLGMYESGETGKEAAAAYVAGYVDGIQAAEATARRKRFCVPDDVTELELAELVAAYVSGKSVYRQMGAPFVIDGALKSAYKCR
jgi:hypothetical protein